MSTPTKDSGKPPVLLPHVRVEVERDGRLRVTIDREPCDVAPEVAALGRDAMPQVIDQVGRRLASPYRLEVMDGGVTFTDIVIPSEQPPHGTVDQRPVTPSWEVTGGGFSPAENVAVAVVVAHRRADTDGVARLRLPSALLAHRPGLVVLLGQTSGSVAVSGGTT